MLKSLRLRNYLGRLEILLHRAVTARLEHGAAARIYCFIDLTPFGSTDPFHAFDRTLARLVRKEK